MPEIKDPGNLIAAPQQARDDCARGCRLRRWQWRPRGHHLSERRAIRQRAGDRGLFARTAAVTPARCGRVFDTNATKDARRSGPRRRSGQGESADALMQVAHRAGYKAAKNDQRDGRLQHHEHLGAARHDQGVRGTKCTAAGESQE